MSDSAVVFNVQHFTIHDGPGIRTELFLKGCPLRCRWCSNPEGLSARIQPGVYRKKCLGAKACGLCEKACPESGKDGGSGPLTFYRGRLDSIDYGRCAGCMACSEACPSEAVKAWGREMTVEGAMGEIIRDRGYYERSGGGVTVSGGEPLLQADFVAELFAACREEGIHTCCESCLNISREQIDKVFPLTDLWIADLKMMDCEKHRENTGAGNERILENLRYLASEGADLILRIPVIPGVNDTQENMEQTADFILNEMGGRIRTLQLLSFMRLGQEKYESLGMEYEMTQQLKEYHFRRDYFQKKVERFVEYFSGRGIHTLKGTREKE